MREISSATASGPSPSLPEVQSIVQTALQKSHARKALVRGKEAFMPLVFTNPETDCEYCGSVHEGFLNFGHKQLNFLHNWKPDVTLEAAANNAGLTVEQARRFLARKRVRCWIWNLSREAAIKRDWDRPEKWYAMGEKMMHQPVVPDHRVKIWQEFGDRSVPKPSRNAPSDARPQITININPSAVEKAFERQAAIDAHIANGEAA